MADEVGGDGRWHSAAEEVQTRRGDVPDGYPAPGFQVEVGKQGPPEVEVEFESESQKIEVQAAWRR